jgi:hypothetical protein
MTYDVRPSPRAGQARGARRKRICGDKSIPVLREAAAADAPTDRPGGHSGSGRGADRTSHRASRKRAKWLILGRSARYPPQLWITLWESRCRCREGLVPARSVLTCRFFVQFRGRRRKSLNINHLPTAPDSPAGSGPVRANGAGAMRCVAGDRGITPTRKSGKSASHRLARRQSTPLGAAQRVVDDCSEPVRQKRADRRSQAGRAIPPLRPLRLGGFCRAGS